MPNKILELSRRCLPPFLSYRENSRVRRICPNPSWGVLNDWFTDVERKQGRTLSDKEHAEEIHFLWYTMRMIHHRRIWLQAMSVLGPWSWRGRTGNLKWWKRLESENVWTMRVCAENGDAALLGVNLTHGEKIWRRLHIFFSYIHFTNVLPCWFLSEM